MKVHTKLSDKEIEYAGVYNCGNLIVTITADNGGITSVSFGSRLLQSQENRNSCTDHASEQIREYLEGKRKVFDLPLNLKGTEFQQKVWSALTKIPYGETRSYKEIAEVIGNPRSCRAVGMANNRNPISIIIPCHRVIGSDGKLVGYGGGIEQKKRLLELEGVISKF